MTLAPGTPLGPYEILSPLGAGGMGEVYRAKDTRLGREVAIKVLPPKFAADPDRLLRFEQEAHAIAALNHPNIVALYDVGSHEEAPFVVTELLQGETLKDRLVGGPLSPRTAVEIGVQIAHGLAAAHAKGVVHRDVKPANVFVTSDGVVKILDFGLAKLVRPEEAASPEESTVGQGPRTESGTVLGTMGYISPEQLRGEEADARSDIFGFGCVLYEMQVALSLYSHTGSVTSVAVSPDGRWIASGSNDGTIRLWPMPDLSKPPLHALPHDELLAKLKSLTNLRAVRDPASDSGWKVEIGPFPGWKDLPTW